jgi:peptide/nickel transport system substrate-binding protein
MDTLNPTAITQMDGGAYNVLHAIYDTLVRSDMNGNPVPDLAESWSYKNATSVTMKLFRNATWHDGTAFTSDDVVFTLNLYLGHKEFYVSNNVRNIRSVSAPDKYTVEINLKKPDATLLTVRLVGAYILPKHIWEKVANFTAFTNTNPVGTGPFKFVRWGGPNTYVEFTANPKYHLGKPQYDRLIIRYFTSYNAMALALQSGEIDFAGPLIPPAIVPTLTSAAGVQVITRPDLRYFYFCFNTYAKGSGNPTLRDKAVRIALSHAINRDELASVVWSGYAKPHSTVLPVSMGDWVNPRTVGYSFDLKKAAQILDDAGYKVGADGVRVSPSGVRMSYRIEVPSNYAQEYRGAQMIASWFKQINVDATAQLVDVGSLADEVIQWKHDMFIWVWGGGGLDPDFYLQVLTGTEAGPAPNPGLNDSGFMNSTYDALYEQQMQEIDPAKRRTIVHRMQDIVHQEAVYVPLYTPLAVQAFRSDKFTGLPAGKIPPLAQSSVTKDLLINIRPLVVRPATTVVTTTMTTAGMSSEMLGMAVAIVIAAVVLVYVAIRKKSVSLGAPK